MALRVNFNSCQQEDCESSLGLAISGVVSQVTAVSMAFSAEDLGETRLTACPRDRGHPRNLCCGQSLDCDWLWSQGKGDLRAPRGPVAPLLR